MKKYLYLISTIGFTLTITPASEEDLTQELSRMKISNSEDYDSDTEYTLHQRSHERFFRRITRHPEARAAIAIFKDELANATPISQISLDGFSSRTRIILIRELIAAADGKKISIPLSLNKIAFKLDLIPTPDQPGSGIISAIGSYKSDIFPVVSAYKESSQRRFAQKLRTARKVHTSHTPHKRDYHLPIPHPDLEEDGHHVNLEMLNLLLDFEIARRLIGRKTEEENAFYAKKSGVTLTSPIKGQKNFFAQQFDSVPIGSAITGMLHLASMEDESPEFTPFELLFDGKDTLIAGHTFRKGDYNPFEGSAGNPRYSDNPPHRKNATKKILKKFRGGKKAKNSSEEDIHQEYLEIYGGASESEGELYDELPKKKSSSSK